jgi:hypothetical protein
MSKQTMKHTIFLILVCLITRVSAQQQRKVISGFIKEKSGKELLIGASVAVPKYKTGTVTNQYGFFSLSLPVDTFELIISYVGYAPKAFRIDLKEDTELNVELEEVKALKEVVVSANKQTANLAEVTRMSVIEIPVQQIKDIPALFGEKDVLKVIQLLPGVQKPSEGSSGIYVRGGGPDQNLIILDDATVYNAFHLFGFFSLFNGDALKSVELTKGGFPARYGGRLSSVIDMSMKEGNKQQFHGEAGIGLVASRLMLEGPIIKNKSSFLISARRTYIDVLTYPLQPSDNKGGYFFYDLNAKANYEIDTKNKLYISGYFGRDKFYFKSRYTSDEQEGGITWGNATATVRWNHLYSNRLFANTSFVFSDYKFGIYQESNFNGSKYELNYFSGIRDYSLKHDLYFRPSNNHTVRAGGQAIYHVFTPSALVIKDDFTGENRDEKKRVGSVENAVYAEDDIKVGLKLRVNPGLRITHFSAEKRNYINLEPRLSTSYNIKSDLAIKASFAVMNQYVHLLSNTGVGLPTDLWVPSSDNLKPQHSWQIAAGIVKDFIEKDFSISVEGYYKESTKIISYKEGASFLEIETSQETSDFSWEKNITSGKGWSYGAEFLLQKKTGKISGWVGYTLSWTQMQFDELNFGKKFWARYDRRHDISVVGIYKIREQKDDQTGVTLSGTWVYGTGNAITLPVAEYKSPVHDPTGGRLSNNGFDGATVSKYTSRNDFRMAPYHRMDLSLQVSTKMKHWVRTWEFSVYNVYNRYNPYFYYIGNNNDGSRVLKQITLFPLIPSVSWNIKF